MPENLSLYNVVTSLFRVFAFITTVFLIAKIWQRVVRTDKLEQQRGMDALDRSTQVPDKQSSK